MSSLTPRRFPPVASCLAALALLMPASLFCPPVQAAPHSSHHSARRLHFAPRQRRIVVIGSFSPRHRPADYTLFAHAGQRLRIRLQDLVLPGHNANNMLVTMYHITFPSGKQYGMKGYDPFPGRLTQNGVYRITVEANQMASNSNVGRFRLTLMR
jgi:hypothetical protein